MSGHDQLPVYFELSWSILSTLGLVSTGISISVGSIVGFSALSIVPLVTSIGCAIANGLCYYAFYTDYPRPNRLAAGVFADLAWLVQEAGLSFYSYQILRRLLRHTERRVFFSLFWACMCSIVVLRFVILVQRALTMAGDPHSSFKSIATTQKIINNLHVAYFVLLAVAECICAYFLLRIFRTAQRCSVTALGTPNNLFHVLARSSEIRLALLGPIGVCRSITYTFQASAQSATNTASQLDRFAYSLECMFPIILIVDLLASKRSMDPIRPNAGNAYDNGPGAVHLGGGGMWSRVVTTSSAGKQLHGDEISLTPPTPPNQILARTHIRQSVTRLGDVDEMA
ncbi:hypothetical protein EDC01DRAFT_418585 [Geopyxis carbonaria]|nr:hypothetical protein EDC01DRAFT_418585 [Geopyxis carbonaria]